MNGQMGMGDRHPTDYGIVMVLTSELLQVFEELIDIQTDGAARSTAVDAWQHLFANFSHLIGCTLTYDLLRRSINAHRFQFSWLPRIEVIISYDDVVPRKLFA